MTKKAAFLVTAQFRTRIVVEVPDDFDTGTPEDVYPDLEGLPGRDLLFLTESNICRIMGEDGLTENIMEVTNDLECPYDPLHDDTL